MDAEATSLAVSDKVGVTRAWVPWAWSGFLIAVLAFLVLYPTSMLLIGALTTTNPVVEGGNIGITAAFSLVQMVLLGVLISFTNWLSRSAAQPSAATATEAAQTGGIARSG